MISGSLRASNICIFYWLPRVCISCLIVNTDKTFASLKKSFQGKFLIGRISQSESRGFSGCVSLHRGRGRLTNVCKTANQKGHRREERGRAGRGDGSKFCGEIETGGTEGKWKSFVPVSATEIRQCSKGDTVYGEEVRGR